MSAGADRARVFAMVAVLTLTGCVHKNFLCLAAPVVVKEQGEGGGHKVAGVVAACVGMI